MLTAQNALFYSTSHSFSQMMWLFLLSSVLFANPAFTLSCVATGTVYGRRHCSVDRRLR